MCQDDERHQQTIQLMALGQAKKLFKQGEAESLLKAIEKMEADILGKRGSGSEDDPKRPSKEPGPFKPKLRCTICKTVFLSIKTIKGPIIQINGDSTFRAYYNTYCPECRDVRFCKKLGETPEWPGQYD